MIKLESSLKSLPQARCLLVVQSLEAPAVSLSTAPVREEINGQWRESTANCMQVVSGYVGGEPFKIQAKLASEYAVEIPSCHKAVVEVEAKITLTTAYEKGDRSRQILQVSLVRVVEVWESATKCLWRAKDGAENAKAEVGLNGGAIRKGDLVGAGARG